MSLHFRAKPYEETLPHSAVAWPGPVGWWYIPLFWLVVVLVTVLFWALN